MGKNGLDHVQGHSDEQMLIVEYLVCCTKTELRVSCPKLNLFLASHPNKVYSRADLMEQVWNYGYVGDDVRTVDVTVRRLREKIEVDPATPALILTRRGVGYYFAA